MFRLALFGGALFGDGTGQFHGFGKIEAHLLLDNFGEGDVRQAHIAGFDEGTTKTTAAGVQLAHAARDKIDENVGVANDFQSFFG